MLMVLKELLFQQYIHTHTAITVVINGIFFILNLVKTYNSFDQQLPILGATDADVKAFRITLSNQVAEVIASAFKLLGIDVPERM